jgi:hypothetical protein
MFKSPTNLPEGEAFGTGLQIQLSFIKNNNFIQF